MPLVFASFMTGTLAAYEQEPGLYGTFTLINGLLGGSVFFFHCTGNERVSSQPHNCNSSNLVLGEGSSNESIQESYKEREILNKPGIYLLTK